MFNPRSIFKPRLFVILFAISFTLCILVTPLGKANSRAIAQISTEQLVQQGVDRYQANDIAGAIQVWQTALTTYQQKHQTEAEAIVLENLARAHQQIGQTSEAVNYWQQATSAYQQLNNLQQVGRMTTEQAQALSQLGQHRQAIALLCGSLSTVQEPVEAPARAEASSTSRSAARPIATSSTAARSTAANSTATSSIATNSTAARSTAANSTDSNSTSSELISGTISETSSNSTCQPTSALALARSQNDRLGEAAALGSLGEVRRLQGDYDQALTDLKASLALAQTLQNSTYEVAALNSLGTVYLGLAQRQYRSAQREYRRLISANEKEAQETADQYRQAGIQADQAALQYFSIGLERVQPSDSLNHVRLLLSKIPAYYHINQPQAAEATIQQVKQLLPSVPDSQVKVYATITLVNLLQPIALDTQQGSPLECFDAAGEAETLLQQAIDLSRKINNPRAESFALGELGHLHECRGDRSQALKLTQAARWAAEQDLKSQDSLYLWEWQTARILNAQGQTEAAIGEYEKAIATLETIRNDLLTTNRNLQFDFRDTIDPLYRQLVGLRLERAQLTDSTSTQSTDQNDKRSNVFKALKTLDSLKLAELQNYFGNNCIILAPTQETVADVGADRNTAVFNSVILADRTAIVVTLPNGTQSLSWINLPQDQIDDTINQYRLELERTYKDAFDSNYAEQLYSWIIAPFTEALAQNQVKTLVFIQDGILRSVPMAALYNSATHQFLVETYAIATTPSLTLTAAQPLDRKNLRALAIGLTQAAKVGDKSFSALQNVAGEISAVEAQLPGSKGLLDQEFTPARLQHELEQTVYPIVHIATHGEFGTEPEDTFLVTGDNQKLTITQLDALLRTTKSREPIELLALTACQTAAGDDRSALGLAGVAIQAGAKSALASLWFIDDAATAGITEQFYAGLRSNSTLSKAAALQAAQVKVIQAGGETAHPGYWAPFILIGNWL